MDKNAEDILSNDDYGDPNERSEQGKQYRLAAAIIALVRLVRSEKLPENEKAELWARIHRDAPTVSRGHYKRMRRITWIVAASLLAGVGIVFFLPERDRSEQNTLLSRTIAASNQASRNSFSGMVIDGRTPIPLDDNAKLSFEGDSVIAMGKGGTSNRFALGDIGETTTITVPYGKRSEVRLPDSSVVWLNAGSALTFPNRFSNEKREVFLSGEAFFEVVHQQSHTPFFVYTGQLQVKVLGTSFNISAYEDDEETGAFLVEGRIELSPQGNTNFKSQILEKGVAATLNKKQGRLAITQKSIDEHIAWTKRQLVLNSTPFSVILKKLERLYNVEIDLTTNDPLADEQFSGLLDLEQPAMVLLKSILEGSDYSMKQKGRRITISKR